MSYKEMFAKTARIVGRKPPRIPLPDVAVKAFGAISSGIAYLTGKAPNVTYKMAKVSCDGHYFSAQKAVRELDMPQTPIDTAIRECFEWFRDNGHLADSSKPSGASLVRPHKPKPYISPSLHSFCVLTNRNLISPSPPPAILEEVHTKEAIHAFHQLPFELYNDDPNWIPYVRQDVEAVFRPKGQYLLHPRRCLPLDHARCQRRK